MPLADFTITTTYNGWPYDVRVVVYNSLSSLRASTTKYDNITRNANKRANGENSDVCGVCHRFVHYDASDDQKPLVAIVRYADPHLGVGVVSHEMAHAAVWLRELSHESEELVCSNDEEFALTLGDLVRQTINGFDKHGVYEKDVLISETDHGY